MQGLGDYDVSQQDDPLRDFLRSINLGETWTRKVAKKLANMCIATVDDLKTFPEADVVGLQIPHAGDTKFRTALAVRLGNRLINGEARATEEREKRIRESALEQQREDRERAEQKQADAQQAAIALAQTEQ